jgi:putative ABC transport system substrate-binding protein
VTLALRARAALGALVVCASLLAISSALAQPAGRPARLGFLAASSPDRERPLLAAFRAALADLGYRDAVVEERSANGRFERLPDLAAELVKRRVDVLVVAGAPPAQAAKRATSTIPIVMTNAADPVGTGLVTSLARPGGNVTGLSDLGEGVVAKRLALMKEVVPAVTRVGVLYNPANPTNPIQLKLTEDAARTLGITVLPLTASRADDLTRVAATIQRERPGALLVMGDPGLGSLRTEVLGLAARSRLPAIFFTKDGIDEGGLMSYGPRFDDLYRRAAGYVDKILRGAHPGDLPIEQPSTFEFVLNLRTARALGIAVPQAVAFRADRVID